MTQLTLLWCLLPVAFALVCNQSADVDEAPLVRSVPNLNAVRGNISEIPLIQLDHTNATEWQAILCSDFIGNSANRTG